MVLAVGSTSLCWVDLLTGVLVYSHHTAAADGDDTLQMIPLFHFIPLPLGMETIYTPYDASKTTGEFECPRGKEVADEGESRSNPAARTSVWISKEKEAKPLVGVSPGVGEPTLLYNAGGLGGRACFQWWVCKVYQQNWAIRIFKLSSGGFAMCAG
ncbi:hypothetical protein BAE44_0019697 [Dichanthelium oligosanthes]|uniref:Uncharacterized protein n=1 Tax=Dichanthelium oligosanthes TaxID=888268 RepID=A0A1E5V293_9POAL|nr:hypothetical protein BAE44_0019697 [Dichanthelium oligosanthes]